MKATFIVKVMFGLVLAVFTAIAPVHGNNARSANIDLNLIIDSSQAYSEVAEDATGWVLNNLIDGLLINGDRITVWSAGEAAKIVYSESIKSDADRENVKRALRSLSAAGTGADFSGALQDAASRAVSTGISYTILISSSAAALTPTLLGPQANLMRVSRVEESRGWLALVVGLNLDSKIKQAAAAFM
jgi:hypothetical protein